ncbi:hypothetical protein AQUCO_02500129v1 [Aquilegia coerulea]|uniref:Smr domain-containing protein n=1 Tax=Aquilegia coerulea TaxID=218851 RepID=A0A2G5D9L3_AQUCA|nr:hypothetical protein AQUCO_02500129v1 [Aquilegia coerulea]
MLGRTQISKISQNARSFLLSGSRCSVADGSSCTSPEDETHVPRTPERNNEVLPVKTGTLNSCDTKTTVTRPKTTSVVQSSSVSAHVSSDSGSVPTSGCEHSVFGDVHTSQTNLLDSSVYVVDQFLKASIVAVGFLSDLVNNRIPSLDGNSRTSHNYVVDTTHPASNIRTSYVKPHSRENASKVCVKPTVEIAGGSSTAPSNGPKGKSQKSGFGKDLDCVSGKSTAKPVGNHNVSLETKVQKPIPQRSTHGPVPKFTSNRWSAENMIKGSDVGIKTANDTLRSFKKITETAPLGKQFANSRVSVERVYRVLQQIKWGPVAEEALKNVNCQLDAYQANQILKQLHDHSVALGFFYWLKRQAGFKHDGHSYTTMIGILGRGRQFGAMNRLLDEMVRDRCMPNVVTYNRVIHSYGRANYMDEAVKVFYKMQEVGCEPDRVTYCTLIDIHAKAGFLDFAMDIYRKMQEAGLTPDTFTYSVMINCLGKAGHLDDANMLFSEMVSQGCVPNLVTYNILIALQAKATNYTGALKLYQDMKDAGFEADKVTYSIVMEVYGHCGYLNEAESVFAEMKQKNWVPDEPVYGLLVDLWGKAGNVDKARSWFQAMLDAGLRPNVPTCNSLLSAFLRVHRFADAYNVLQSMLELGLQPSLQTYTLLLSCCTDTKSQVDMIFCCDLMTISGHPAHLFLMSMPAAGPDGQNVRDHASNFLDLMHSEDRESKRGLVDAVVDFLHKTGLKEEASSVWEVAAQRNVYPDALREKSSCYWLINLHVMSDGTAVTALSRTLAWLRRKMLASGIGPNRIDIVTGWGRRSRVTGSSLVRQSVEDLLHVFGFPFFTENGNSGCFVGRGEALNRWLLQSYVERMHLI